MLNQRKKNKLIRIPHTKRKKRKKRKPRKKMCMIKYNAD